MSGVGWATELGSELNGSEWMSEFRASTTWVGFRDRGQKTHDASARSHIHG